MMKNQVVSASFDMQTQSFCVTHTHNTHTDFSHYVNVFDFRWLPPVAAKCVAMYLDGIMQKRQTFRMYENRKVNVFTFFPQRWMI